MSMQHGQPATWGTTMPQQCSTTQAANQATFPTVGGTQTHPTSTMDAATVQTIGMMHAASQHASAQYIFPTQPQPSFPTHTTHPFANLLTQQLAQAPNVPPTPSTSHATTTTAEALSLTTLARNMDPVARRQLIQLLASHEPTTTSIGGLGVATQQPTQQPQQPPSQHNQPPPPAQTHVSTATTDTTAVDAPRSAPTATPQSSTRPNSPSPQRKHDRSYRSHKQHRRSRTSHSESPAHRRRRQQRRRSSTSSRRPRRHQPVHRQRSRKHPTSPRRSRSRPGERSPPALRVMLRSRSPLGLSTFTTPPENKSQWRRAGVSPETKRKPQPPRTREQLSAQFIRMAKQQSLQAQLERSSASGHAASRQPPTPPPGRRTLTPPQRTHDQMERDEEDAEQSAHPTTEQHKHHSTPASRILPPRSKPAPVSQQRFWRAIVPKPCCQLRDAEKPRRLSYEVASANQFAHTLAEMTEGAGLSTDTIHAFSRMIHETGLQDRTEVLRTTVLDIGQGVYKVVFIPIDMGAAPLAFGQHPDEARGSVWRYVAAHGTDKEGTRGILLDNFTRPSSEDT